MPVEWNALFAACNLFRETAKSVGAHFGYDYPAEDDRRVSEHLKRVRGTAEHIAERCR
jgi:aminoglycoside 6-adenylyltransferase